MNLKKFCLLAFSLFLLGVFPSGLPAENFADYYPVSLGRYWTYANAVNPNDKFTETAFERITYEGKPAFKLGPSSSEYIVCYNDNTTFSLYAFYNDGVLHDLSEDIQVGEFSDCDILMIGDEPTMLRLWDNLDPVLKSVYNIDPSLSNLVLMVSYDSDFPPNAHNTIVESNAPPGTTFPDAAVTELSWYMANVGYIIELDIDAASGSMGDRFNLVDGHTFARLGNVNASKGSLADVLYVNDSVGDAFRIFTAAAGRPSP